MNFLIYKNKIKLKYKFSPQIFELYLIQKTELKIINLTRQPTGPN